MSLKSIKNRTPVLCGAPQRQRVLINSCYLPEAWLQQQESVLSLLSYRKLWDVQFLIPLVSNQPVRKLTGNTSIHSIECHQHNSDITQLILYQFIVLGQ